MSRVTKSSIRPYLLSVGLVALVSAIGVPVHLMVSPVNLVMFYLAAVVIAALYLGRGPAALAAVLGIVAFDLLFVPPRLKLTVSDTEYLLTFAGLFVVALVVSSLAAQLRDQERATRQREGEARALYEFSRDLARADDIDRILEAVADHIHSAFGRETLVLLPQGGVLAPRPPGDGTWCRGEDGAAADWAFREGRRAGRASDAFSSASARYLPLATARGTVGVLAIRGTEKAPDLAPEQDRLLEVFASVAAVAVERSQLADEARRAQVAQAAEKLQSALLDSISHDLRTPLVTITGALTALEDEASLPRSSTRRLDTAARLGLLTNARQEAERLNRLVGNLLDIARLEAGALHVAPFPVDIEALIGSALERLGDRLADHPVKLVASEAPVIVPMDAALIVQVLVNLLDNAAKHGPPGAPIGVRVSSSPAGLSVAVEDDGPGVPPAELPHIFDKFHRLQRPGGPMGTGLGLAICKGIVEAHGGRIVATNRTPRGLVVEVILPLPDGTGTPAPAPAATEGGAP